MPSATSAFVSPPRDQASSTIAEEHPAGEWDDLQHAINASSPDELENDEDDSDKENVATKGRAGRPSSEDLHLLDEKLTMIQNEILSLSTTLRRNPSSIIKLLVGRVRSGGANTWSHYQKYYKANQDDELQRLPDRSFYDCK